MLQLRIKLVVVAHRKREPSGLFDGDSNRSSKHLGWIGAASFQSWSAQARPQRSTLMVKPMYMPFLDSLWYFQHKILNHLHNTYHIISWLIIGGWCATQPKDWFARNRYIYMQKGGSTTIPRVNVAGRFLWLFASFWTPRRPDVVFDCFFDCLESLEMGSKTGEMEISVSIL